MNTNTNNAFQAEENALINIWKAMNRAITKDEAGDDQDITIIIDGEVNKIIIGGPQVQGLCAMIESICEEQSYELPWESKFVVGKLYKRPGLFGPDFWVRCMSNDGVNVSFVEAGYETEIPTIVPLEIVRGMEQCECWTHGGNNAYIYSDADRNHASNVRMENFIAKEVK